MKLKTKEKSVCLPRIKFFSVIKCVGQFPPKEIRIGVCEEALFYIIITYHYVNRLKQQYLTQIYSCNQRSCVIHDRRMIDITDTFNGSNMLYSTWKSRPFPVQLHVDWPVDVCVASDPQK